MSYVLLASAIALLFMTLFLVIYDAGQKSDRVVSLYTDTDVTLSLGRYNIPTGYSLKRNQMALVVPCMGNANCGFAAKAKDVFTNAVSDYRCDADIVTTVICGGEVCVTLKVNSLCVADSEMAYIPKGTKIAELVLL